ncbi:efflux RND transporter periplasmic adaptor subunit [Scleromatobacter humisilvae]|uniref:Efflux RND transporter periplasmic adaptor subunit n=1 Tax=Scleromatobacter humisilvae TaxID=2897159 RepID=A0A9X1YL54_9BURK|nr:efflux RND transporter periplasmic adaptor subunit [Scleromatobacter humisilvae]MCK9688193.1 efflux RND transporter periplasmic adaptor subunit [Scleromatobacter humisilvae]
MPHFLAHRASRLPHAAAVLAAALTLAACGDKAPPSGPPPAPEVGVVTVAPKTLDVPTELPGRVEALRVAQVRARVTGIVQKRLFVEGTDVKEGQVLFQIDPAPYKAAIDSARAALAKAQANELQATGLLNRYKPLREANAISQQDFVNATSSAAQASADVASAKAAVQTAQLNLDYATVTAPISGRIGQALVTEGALVTSTEATQMALIQQVDQVYVNFAQPVSDIVKLRKAFASGSAKALGVTIPVRIALDDGTEMPQAGKLLFSDLSVDQTSGQVNVRAKVPNPDGALMPGMYVRGRIAQQQVSSAVLLPQQAVQRTTQNDTVLVVGADGKPSVRVVKLGGTENGNWIVLDGLKPGELVVVDGFQKIRPGGSVKPVPWTPSAPTTAAPVAASAASR